MAGSQKPDSTTETPLIPKLIRWPQDWVERVDQVRGDQSFSDFVRTAVHMLIDNGELSTPPAWGQGTPKIISPEEIIEQIRQATDEELNKTVSVDSSTKKRSA
ncbi:MAG: hypothetical protein O2983_06385 [Planctomycetota bacterium]|nr:hypothetical protein [Planctomycetota bacterium]MDA0921005.1 hypothetical protein [Planctomycetota bacterium]MDA1159223.1 hypothetical protein [Planctomycetota bacterium]